MTHDEWMSKEAAYRDQWIKDMLDGLGSHPVNNANQEETNDTRPTAS